ncbi:MULTISPECIES: hypothetical protein [Bacteria]|jgi:hypothetical protein|uniref:Uncharacterized protein motB.1 n=9 Tax=root TaxID=1 RepID=D9IE42_BPT4|nr:hypothetical protein T4Tp011 [Enterobacteria phage T4T]AIT74924.1 hypothetical protein RB55_p012 [Enterobacteria phage RB55]AIT75196.1 hypothetical protein RB59_012 [Enterobacteria phage RB59]QPI17238.1 hypothetical protein [Escherichia phage T4]QZB89659.1 hypothetical protein T4583L_12 [Escherichia phage T4]
MIKINTAYQMKKPSEIDFQTMSNTTDSKFWELLGTTGGYPFTVISVNSGILIGTVYMEIRNYYGRVSSFIIYEEDFNLLTEIEKPEDPTDLLCKAVYIRRPFANPIGGWVTDQWIEDGVELLNVVHAGEYSVVPRSAVVAILN